VSVIWSGPVSALGDKAVEIHAAHDLDDTAQNVGRYAIFPEFARLVRERQAGSGSDHPGE